MAGKEVRELQYLERYYEKAGSQLIILYGQKHMAMNELLSAFCEDKPHSFFKARPFGARTVVFMGK